MYIYIYIYVCIYIYWILCVCVHYILHDYLVHCLMHHDKDVMIPDYGMEHDWPWRSDGASTDSLTVQDACLSEVNHADLLQIRTWYQWYHCARFILWDSQKLDTVQQDTWSYLRACSFHARDYIPIRARVLEILLIESGSPCSLIK